MMKSINRRGGGSIPLIRRRALSRRSASAGADPRSLSPRRSLTVTDASLMTGKRLIFPKCLALAAMSRSTRRSARPLSLARDRRRTGRAIADGFLAIAVAKMAGAIKTFRWRGATTSRAMRSIASAARAGSTPATSPTLAFSRPHPSIFVCCFRPMAWDWPTSPRNRARSASPSHRSARSDRLHRGSLSRAANTNRGGVAGRRSKVHRRAQLRGFRYDDQGSALSTRQRCGARSKEPIRPLRFLDR